jgi:hypothetical protein
MQAAPLFSYAGPIVLGQTLLLQEPLGHPDHLSFVLLVQSKKWVHAKKKKVVINLDGQGFQIPPFFLPSGCI